MKAKITRTVTSGVQGGQVQGGVARRTIAVIGLGYVGLATGLALASAGYRVVGVDINERVVRALSRGELHIYEPGMSGALRSALERGLFRATTSYDEAVRESEVIFVSVGTPSRGDGSIDLEPLMGAARMLADALRGRPGRLVVLRSTVVPGTTRRVMGYIAERSGHALGETMYSAYNPEFLREGRALEDVLRPGRVIIGEVDPAGAGMLESLWREFYSIVGEEPSFMRLPAETAEAAKYANNTFLAAKISFINELARICELTPNCDIALVARAMGLDPRISPHYLGAGLGYGGSCLPKDTKALYRYAESLGVEPYLLRAVDRVNETQVSWVLDRIEAAAGPLRGRTLAVLGVSFKEGSCDTRESRSLALIRGAAARGARVVVHDPCIERGLIDCGALPECRGARAAGSVEEAVRSGDVIVIATPWPEYRSLARLSEAMRGKTLYDARRLLTARDYEELRRSGVRVLAIGLGPRG